MPSTLLRALAMLTLLPVLLACSKQETVKPPERIINVTVAQVAKRDLPIVEAAVGAETAFGFALDYDPTRVAPNTVYVRLPFPEHVAAQLRIGQEVTLSSFADPALTARGRILEIRPALVATALSREVIVAVDARRGWRPSGSVRGEVVLGVRRNAHVVPEQSVVLRRAGAVVYVVDGDSVRERRVETGIVRGGLVEIVGGLAEGETVVVDGAGLLSDGARINVLEAKSYQALPASPAPSAGERRGGGS